MLCQRALLFSLLVVIFGEALAAALLGVTISSPETLTNTRTAIRPVVPQKATEKNNSLIRVRRFQSSDVDAVSSILATSSLTNDRKSHSSERQQWNWNDAVHNLRVKDTFRSHLLHRHQAVQAGRRATKDARKIIAANSRVPSSSASNTSDDVFRIVWSNYLFRHKLQKAAGLSTEANVWRDRNLELPPQDPSWMQHIMMTAQDVGSGDVVGFCEVAMLKREKDDVVLPMICNLVVCPHHRRRGIGSTMMKRATRYVRQHWSSEQIGLLVDRDNQGAQALYLRHRFRLVSSGTDQVYMTRTLDLSSHTGTERVTLTR